MKLFNFLATALALSVLASAASAEIVKRKGSSAFIGTFGSWYVTKTTFEDGSRACFAHNLQRNRNLPRLSILSVIGGEYPGPWVQYEGQYGFAPGAAVDLTIGSFATKMKNGPQDTDAVLTPLSEKAAVQIVNALLDLEKAGQRFFYVSGDAGRTYKFNIGGTAKVVGYLERNCAFEH